MTETRIPATSANLGVLFDKGGVALDAFENIIGLKESDKFSLKVSGLGSWSLPQNKDNLVYKAINYFYNETGKTMPVFSIETKNMIPLSKGLGSSAACIAGGIFAANSFEGGILSVEEVIMLAADMEGHGDNVCAAVTGGFSLYSPDNITVIPAGNELGFILYIPKTTLNTKESRGILPSSYDSILIRKAAELEKSMVRALIEKDYEKAGSLMELDVIHQPYRKKLLPYWDDVMNLSKAAGVWGTALSGAGPAMISMCRLDEVIEIIRKIKKRIDMGYDLSIIGCGVNTQGARGL